jgi:superfamily II DNA/RNA helicase
VALVKGVQGSRGKDYRERVFAGFNTPLLPEVLICTEVGQEGIDLHRHCRHVVQYDLAWNPAVVEQRTGRVDGRVVLSRPADRRRGVGRRPDDPLANGAEVHRLARPR